MKQSIGIHIPPPPKQHYDVHLGTGLLSDLPELLPPLISKHALVILTDNTVKKLYGKNIVDIFSKHNKKIEIIAFKSGEENKTQATKTHLESELLNKKYGRDTCIIALGGGVVGDMAGFVAATYMRGIPYIHIPTTLLAMIDSSIGGKTAINTPEGKNLLGAFWNPVCVIADLNCLDTLSDTHITNGWVEALKIFMTCDASAFKEASQAKKPTMHLIKRAIELKADIVTRDPHERNERAVLNFGHTIGHSLERVTDYALLHGHAVGYGILVEAHISANRGLLTRNDLTIITAQLESAGIVGKKLKNYKIADVLAHTRSDKKSKKQEVHYVLLNGIGKTLLKEGHHTHVVSDNEVALAWEAAIKGETHGGK